MMHLYLWFYYLIIVVFNVLAFGFFVFYLPDILYFIITGGFDFAFKTD